MRVLLVDDERDVRVLLRLCLDDRCEGIEHIEEAKNGLEAVEKVQSFRPDVVIMDMKMPVMDGVEATREIKRVAPESDVVVYSVTSDYAEELAKAGASDHFLKGDIEGLFGYICPSDS